VSAPGRTPLRLRVEAPGVPRPALLRSAIAERLAGRRYPGAAEDAVGRAVADLVAAATEARATPRGRPWR